MKLQRCNNGHFYDGDKFPSCPHCSGAGSVNAVPVTPEARPVDDDKTVSLNMGGAVEAPVGVPFTVAGGAGDVTVPLGGAGETHSGHKG